MRTVGTGSKVIRTGQRAWKGCSICKVCQKWLGLVEGSRRVIWCCDNQRLVAVGDCAGKLDGGDKLEGVDRGMHKIDKRLRFLGKSK